MSRISLDEALLTLNGTGPVLEIVREVSKILRDSGIEGAIIGGVAVGLHGHLRTTVDVDVYIASEGQRFADQLKANGFAFDAANRQFVKRMIPIHVVTLAQIGIAPTRLEDINDIRTVSLADLINIKLRSGRDNVLRAKDMGDVIDLMRRHKLGGDFVPRIDKSLRADFRKLVDAMQNERQQH